MIKSIVHLPFILLMALIVVGCNANNDESPEPISPKVTATVPADGAVDVLTNTVLSVTFDRGIDASTLTDTSFSLGGVTGTIAYDAATRTASFTPDEPLAPDTDYTAYLTTGISSTSGGALETVFDLSFRTEPYIQRVSVGSDGSEGDDKSYFPEINSDGRYVVFDSEAENLVSNDSNIGGWDVFIRDTKTPTTVKVSVNGFGSNPDISADGRFVVFHSNGTNLVSDDNNGKTDVFLYDTETDQTQRVSVDSSGLEANGNSYYASISADGRFVAFQSQADNLVSGDTNAKIDAFLHDTQTGITTRVSVDSGGAESDGDSYVPVLSADGRYVVYDSEATNLVSGDTNSSSDVFLHDTQTGTTTRVSVDSTGVEGNDDSLSPDISVDGRFVVYYSYASNLIAGDTNNSRDIFLHDTQTDITNRLSVDSSGVEADNASINPAISADSRLVVFESSASNLVSDDTNGADDIFVHDTETSSTHRISINTDGIQANGSSYYASISADGRYSVFISAATNLAPEGDTNARIDVFRVLNTPR
jgi:hypothetical protein